MKRALPQKRRDFLRSAAAAGAFGLLTASCRRQASTGAADSGSPESVPLDKVMPRLEAIGREYVTIPKPEGQFLNLLIKLTRATRVLELGTGYGYTTIWLALALAETGGKLTTIEIVPERVALAKQHLAEVGLSHRVSFHQGDAHAIVPTLEGPFDIAYLDADKGGQVDYFNKLFPAKLAAGSLLIAHNATLRADAMKDYLELVGQHPEFDTLLVSATMDDAFAISYRKRAPA